MKNVHPCTFFIDEFEAKPQTSLLLRTSGIRAAFCEQAVEQRWACGAALRCETAGEQNGGSFRPPASYAAKPNRQNV